MHCFLNFCQTRPLASSSKFFYSQFFVAFSRDQPDRYYVSRFGYLSSYWYYYYQWTPWVSFQPPKVPSSFHFCFQDCRCSLLAGWTCFIALDLFWSCWHPGESRFRSLSRDPQLSNPARASCTARLSFLALCHAMILDHLRVMLGSYFLNFQ